MHAVCYCHTSSIPFHKHTRLTSRGGGRGCTRTACNGGRRNPVARTRATGRQKSEFVKVGQQKIIILLSYNSNLYSLTVGFRPALLKTAVAVRLIRPLSVLYEHYCRTLISTAGHN